jgi:hypothetical protein
MLNFDSPAAMALSLSNMGGLDGIGMGISMSGLSALNLGTSMGGRGDDEDRRKRLEAVVNLLKSRPARVGPEGLELLGKRVGMAVLLDPSDGPRKNGTRECAIAGGSVVIDASSRFTYFVQVHPNCLTGIRWDSQEITASIASICPSQLRQTL